MCVHVLLLHESIHLIYRIAFAYHCANTYIHIHIYTYIYIYIYHRTYIYIYIYMHAYVCLYIKTYVCVHMWKVVSQGISSIYFNMKWIQMECEWVQPFDYMRSASMKLLYATRKTMKKTKVQLLHGRLSPGIREKWWLFVSGNIK